MYVCMHSRIRTVAGCIYPQHINVLPLIHRFTHQVKHLSCSLACFQVSVPLPRHLLNSFNWQRVVAIGLLPYSSFLEPCGELLCGHLDSCRACVRMCVCVICVKNTCTYISLSMHTYIYPCIHLFIHTGRRWDMLLYGSPYSTRSCTHMHTYMYTYIYSHEMEYAGLAIQRGDHVRT
jgi:hypothetical protein